MKKTLLLIISYLTFINVSKVPAYYPSDYRDDFVGEFVCEKVCRTIKEDQTGLEIIEDKTSIEIIPDTRDSILVVIVHDKSFLVKLRDSVMYAYPFGNNWGGKFFSDGSMGFYTSLSKAVNSCTYRGKRSD